jgi:hypothetical protein
MFAEQKIGSGSRSILETEESRESETEIRNQISSVFKGFNIDIVSQSNDVKWSSRKIDTLVGNISQGSFGFGLCLLKGADRVILFQFGGIRSMTEDTNSVKLCDNRLIFTDSITMKQGIADSFVGPKISGRKYPTMSSAENILEEYAHNQKLFIFGGIDTSGN